MHALLISHLQFAPPQYGSVQLRLGILFLAHADSAVEAKKKPQPCCTDKRREAYDGFFDEPPYKYAISNFVWVVHRLFLEVAAILELIDDFGCRTRWMRSALCCIVHLGSKTVGQENALRFARNELFATVGSVEVKFGAQMYSTLH